MESAEDIQQINLSRDYTKKRDSLDVDRHTLTKLEQKILLVMWTNQTAVTHGKIAKTIQMPAGTVIVALQKLSRRNFVGLAKDGASWFLTDMAGNLIEFVAKKYQESQQDRKQLTTT